MAIIKPTGYFKLAGTGSDWTWPDAAYDNNYSNYVKTSGAQYFYKFAVTEAQAKRLNAHIYWWSQPSRIPECTYSIGYGNETGSTIVKSVLFTPAAKDFIVPFSLSASEYNTLAAHASELLIGIRQTESSMKFLAEIDIEAPDASQIYVGGRQAGAVYAGDVKASAVYIGDERIL